MATEVERLRDKVYQLEQLLGIDTGMTNRLRFCLSLTVSEAKIVGFMLKREIASYDSLSEVLWGLRNDGDQPDNAIPIIQQFIHKARRKLKPIHVTITSNWGTGVSMSPPNKARLRAHLDGTISDHIEPLLPPLRSMRSPDEVRGRRC